MQDCVVKLTILGKDFSTFGGELSMLMKYSANNDITDTPKLNIILQVRL